MPDLPTYPGTPRWVKVAGVVAAVLVLIFVALLHAGVIHGPGLHGGQGDHQPSAGAHERGER
jgi:hypothetical protein